MPKTPSTVLRARVDDLLALFRKGNETSSDMCNEALAPFQAAWHSREGVEALFRVQGSDLLMTLASPVDDCTFFGMVVLADGRFPGTSVLGQLLVIRLAMAAYPDDPELWYRQGEALYKAGHHALAEQSLIHSEDHDSDVPEKHWLFISNDGSNDRWVDRPCLLLASVMQSRTLPDAILRFEELRGRYDCEDPDLQNGLAVCHAMLGDYVQAASHLWVFLDTMKQRELGSGEYYDSDRRMLIVGHLNLAWCQLRRGDQIGAAVHFGRARQLIEPAYDQDLHEQILQWYDPKAGLSTTTGLTWSLRRDYSMLMLHPRVVSPTTAPP